MVIYLQFLDLFLFQVAINYGYEWQIPAFYTVGALLLPYVSDALTFSSPYILLFCSPTLRALLKKMLQKIFCKQNISVSPVVVVCAQ